MNDDWFKASMRRSIDGGLNFVEKNPDLTFEFNVRGSANIFPPSISAKNGAAKQLEDAIEGNEGHSGASFYCAFASFMKEGKERGFFMGNDPETGTYIIRKNPPGSKTEADVKAMKPIQLKQKP